MQRISDHTCRTAEVIGGEQGDGVVHVFCDGSALDDETFAAYAPEEVARWKTGEGGDSVVRRSNCAGSRRGRQAVLLGTQEPEDA